ncbi:cobalt ECF transporter T component CbiQ [Synechocystis sp. LKSZ1]|uniref:cobalt ECF transporter T component CbiQ n=1 Tax=Synechocystis sp. LKSZ1 TaxID=3144951 RepID=UPI00336C0F1E
MALDQYAHLDSWLHRWHPRYKLIGLLALIVAFAQVESLALLPAMVAVTLTLYSVSKLPWHFLAQRLRYPSLFLLGMVGLLPFYSGQTILGHWGWLSLRQEGLEALLLTTTRFWAIMTLSLILLGTMSFLTTARTLRSLGLPALLIDLLLLSYRYLFEIGQDWQQMHRAMALRGFGATSLARPPAKYRQIGQLAAVTATLLIRSYERAERIYQAMRLRGYGTPRAVNEVKALSGITTALGPDGYHKVGLVFMLLIASIFVLIEVIY